MFHIVWKNFRANIKNFLAFFISIIIAVNVVFLIVYIGQAASNVKRDKSLVFAYQTAGGLTGTTMLVIPVVLIAALVIVYSVQFYIHSRLRDYGMLTILGIRKKDLRRFLILEYGLGCTAACVGGLVLGNISSYFAGKVLEHMAKQNLTEAIRMNKVYLLTLGLCIVMIGVCLFGLAILLEEKDISTLMNSSAGMKKKISRKGILALLTGLALAAGSVVYVAKVGGDWGNTSFAHSLMYAGIFISICFGTGYLMEQYRKTKHYYKGILVWNRFLYYFQKDKYVIIVQTVLGFFILLFSFTLINQNIPLEREEYANDFVCIVDEGDSFLKEFEERYGGDNISFPFAWVGDGSIRVTIGMSVSDYNRVFGESEELKPDEMISLLDTNNDTESKIDQPKYMKTALWHIGKNVRGIGPGETDNKYIVKWERKKEFLGYGMEGLAVFSDETFQKALEKDDFHQDFLLLNVKKEQMDNATEFVQQKKSEGIVKEALCEKILSEADLNDRILALGIFAVVSVALLLCGMFTLWLKIYSEGEQIKEKYRFLTISGIKTKERKRTLNKEVTLIIAIPVILSVAVTVPYCMAWIWSKCNAIEGADNRIAWGIRYYKELAVIVVIYLILQGLFMTGVRLWARKTIIN